MFNFYVRKTFSKKQFKLDVQLLIKLYQYLRLRIEKIEFRMLLMITIPSSLPIFCNA